jgi:hypothetical protein
MLEGNPDLDTLYLLLGPAKTSAHQDAYQKAKELLTKRIKVNHRIVEEYSDPVCQDSKRADLR